MISILNRTLGPLGVSRTNGAVDLTTGLIAHWRFDEGSGTSAADSSGNGYTGTLNGPTWSAGRVGSNALDFDGSNDQVTTGAINFGVKTITLSFWLYKASFLSSNLIGFELTTNFNNTDGAFLIQFDNSTGKMSAAIQDSVTINKYRVESWARPSAGAWHHYAIILDNSTNAGDITTYIDGSAVTNTVDQNNKDNSTNFSTSALYFMSRAGTSLFCAGSLDDVRIYNRALTSTEIAALAAM